MSQLPYRIRLVSIPSPYDRWTDPMVQSLFCKTLQMRLNGYGSEYGSGVFPLDGADFAGAHHMACQEYDGQLIPIMGFRTTSLSTAKRHGLSFGGLNLVKAAGAIPHTQALQSLLEHCETEGHEISYIASWTMEPSIRKDRELSRLLRELFMAMSVHAHLDTRSRIIGGCTMRFKIDQWFRTWGFEPLRGQSGDLEPARIPFLLGEQVRMMYLKSFTPEILAAAAPWRDAWEQRLVLSAQESVVELGRAA